CFCVMFTRSPGLMSLRFLPFMFSLLSPFGSGGNAIQDPSPLSLQRHLIYSWARCRGNLFILAHFRCSPTVVGPPSPSPQRMAAPSWATSEVDTAGRPGAGTSEREMGVIESIFYYKNNLHNNKYSHLFR